MKKLLTLIILTLTLIGSFTFNVFAINVDYSFNITDNKKWNLNTGLIENDLKYSITSKMIVGAERIYTQSQTYHHVLFWNKYNEFIGYKNTQYSIYENDKYISNIEYGNSGFDAPATAKYYSFMIYKSGNSVVYEELNGQTLNEIFNNYDDTNLGNKENPILDNYTINEFAETQLTGKNLFDEEVELGFIDSSGQNGTIGTGSRTTNFTNVNASTSYTISYDYYTSAPTVFYIFEYDASYNFILRTQTSNPQSNNRIYATITTQSNTAYLRFRTDTNFNGLFENAQIEKGSTATPYEPYGNYLTREYFKDYEQIPSVNYTELDNGRLRYVVNQDTIANEYQPLHELNGLSLNDLFDTNNLITNGDFSNGTSNWLVLNNASFSVTNNIASITATQQYSAVQQQVATANAGDVIFGLTYAYLSNSSQEIYINDGVGQNSFAKLDGQYDYHYGRRTQLPNSFLLKIVFQDNNTSNFQTMNVNEVYLFNLTTLGIENLTDDKIYDYYEIYAYFRDGGTDPQTFTYESPIYYDITYRLDEQFNGLDITAQQFIDFQDGYNRIINNEQANDFIIYYAVQHAQDNNPTLSFTTEQWEQYYSNYLLFEDANTPYIEELNYYSLNEVFDDGNLIINGDFSNGITGWITNTAINYNGYLKGNSFYPNTTQSVSFINNHKYYFVSEFYTGSGTLSNSYSTLNFRVLNTSNSTIVSLNGQTVSNSGIVTGSYDKWETKSTVYTMTETYTTNVILRVSASSYQTPYDIRWDNIFVLDLTTLGITSLTQNELDNYYNDYIDNQTLEQNLYLLALQTTSFNIIQPYYDYTEPAPDDFLDVDSETFLDNLLTDIGFNNDLGRIGLSLVVLFFTALTLIKLNMPNSVIISVEILTFVGLSFLGWLPAWINIVIALGIIILLYLRFKGNGGGSNEESD